MPVSARIGSGAVSLGRTPSTNRTSMSGGALCQRPKTSNEEEGAVHRSVLGSAESLGIVMGSFTLVARVWIGTSA